MPRSLRACSRQKVIRTSQMAEKVSTKERVGNTRVLSKQMAQTEALKTYVAMPGIVQSFDAEALTVVVQPAIQGKQMLEDGTTRAVNLPLLQDVPVVFPHAGGCSLTFPVKQGDECLVIFADRCIDAWWQLGGVQPQLCGRYHSLSDGFAILGVWSQVTKIKAVSTDRVELRSDDAEAVFSINPESHDIELSTTGNVNAAIGGTLTADVKGNTTLKAPSILFDSPSVHITGKLQVDQLISGTGGFTVSGGSGIKATGDIELTGSMKSSGDVQAGSISLQSHVHSGVQSGGDSTGQPE